MKGREVCYVLLNNNPVRALRFDTNLKKITGINAKKLHLVYDARRTVERSGLILTT